MRLAIVYGLNIINISQREPGCQVPLLKNELLVKKKYFCISCALYKVAS